MSLFFNFEDEQSTSPISPKSAESPLTRKRKADSENDSEASKKIKSEDEECDSKEPPITAPVTLFDELSSLEKEFNLKFETTDLDSLNDSISLSTQTITPNGNQLESPWLKSGKTLVFCFLPNSTLRISFRLSKSEYEQAVLDRKSRISIIHAEYFDKFRHYGCGLEEVEVVADQSIEYYDDIFKIHSFATDVGVGIAGNMVQISDIVRYTFDNILKNKN